MKKLLNLFSPVKNVGMRKIVDGWAIARIVALLFVVTIVSANWPLRTVPTGYGGVITTMGKIVDTQGDGPAWVWPWQKLNVFNLRLERASINNAQGGTKDLQPVAVDMLVSYSIIPNRMAEVFEQYSRDGDLSANVQSATAEVFKAVTARFNATELIERRNDVSAAIREALAIKLKVFGAQVISVDMTGFSFSQSYMAAVNDKVTQEQKRQAADNKLKTVESEQKQKVAIAEAEASATRATADGEAYASLTNAKAQAESIKIQSAALSQNKEVLELRRIEVEKIRAERWDGALPTTMYGSAPIPFLNAK
jgi:prohibitin 2